MKKVKICTLIIAVLALSIGCYDKIITALPAPSSPKPRTSDDGGPRFWVGIYYKAMENDAERSQILNTIQSEGWGGVMTWGADTVDNGESIKYYFDSPFLETQDWAISGGDYLSPLVDAAHARGLKAAVALEGVSPYNWPQYQWTPENIKEVVDDLANSGVDMIFQEGFGSDISLFQSLASETRAKVVDFVAGADPMILREPGYSSLWPTTSEIDMYNYYLNRDHNFNGSSLTQHGSIGYGWAKYWNMRKGFMATISQEWGIPVVYSKAVVSYLALIRALQFGMDDYYILGEEELQNGQSSFDPNWIKDRIQTYTNLQEDRPLMDIIVLMDNTPGLAGETTQAWNGFFNSGDAITSGAFNAGYNVVVSNAVVPDADAYWVYVAGNETEIPDEVAALFQGNKKVFLQSGTNFPRGSGMNYNWKSILEKCGIDADDNSDDNTFPEADLSAIGYYNGEQLTFTGTDTQWNLNLPEGTVFPPEVVTGTVYCKPDENSDDSAFIVGDNDKYVVAATCLHWSVSSVISDILSGAGTSLSSNVWGIAGENVSALLAIGSTDLHLVIPGLGDGSMIHVEVWNKNKVKILDEDETYAAPFTLNMNQYDFLLINHIQ